ncbi:unnamed protein product [Heterobilharzia americana]|nr:unnamed protein product [Heterobilharzia americana]
MKILSKRRFCIVLLLLLGSSFLTLIYYSNQSLLKCLFTHPFVPVKQSSKTTNYPFVYDSNNNDKINIADGLKPFPVVIYNRIPKTGSTSLVNLVYQLIEEKRLYTHVLHLNISTNRHYLNRRNELNLVNNLTHWTSMHPLMIHGHFAYINFKKYGSSLNPIYINMIRNPLDRLVSYYYFLRYGDDYRPYLFRKRMSDPVTRNQTFDECVRMKGSDCNPQLLWVQVPFFCGPAAYCRIPGNPTAVETAKRRVIEQYLIVGLTEKFGELIHLLEVLLPSFFSGALELISRSPDKWYLRRTNYKLSINQKTIEFFQKNSIWQAEQEFYDFVSQEFFALLNVIQSHPSGKTSPRISGPYNENLFLIKYAQSRCELKHFH